VALFSQDDSDEDETPSMAAAFSGFHDPDEETETPVPEEPSGQQDTPEVTPPDDANAYAQEPTEEGEGKDNISPEGPAPGEEDGSQEYAGAPESDAGEPEAAGGAGVGVTRGVPTLPPVPALGDWSADRAALEGQYAKEAQQNVKPSVGRRILAGLAGAATTFGGGNGNQVVQTVLNRPAAQAQAGWTRQEAPLKQQLTNDAAQDAQTQRNYQNQRQAANDAALNQQRQEHAADYAQTAYEKSLKLVPVDPNNKFGEWQQVDPKGKVVARGIEPPAAIKNDPDYESYRIEKTISDAQKSGHPFTNEQQQILRGGGKIGYHPAPIPRQPAAGELEYNGALAAFKASHGGRGPQTTAEQNQVSQAAHGTMKDVPDEAQTILDKQLNDKEAYAQQFKRDPATGNYTNVSTGASVPAQEFASKIDKFRTDANVKLQKMGYQIDPQGNFGPVGQQNAPASQPAGQQPPAQGTKPASQPQTPIVPPKATTPKPAGATGRVRGSDGNWYWIAGNKVIGKS
jgi:hypothetical protein